MLVIYKKGGREGRFNGAMDVHVVVPCGGRVAPARFGGAPF